jgi:hypothetical protein
MSVKKLLLVIIIASGSACNAHAQAPTDCTKNPFAPCLGAPATPYATPPSPPSPSGYGAGNSCEAGCKQQQNQCMSTCPQQHDWYRCFGQICADAHTICMQGCR